MCIVFRHFQPRGDEHFTRVEVPLECHLTADGSDDAHEERIVSVRHHRCENTAVVASSCSGTVGPERCDESNVRRETAVQVEAAGKTSQG